MSEPIFTPGEREYLRGVIEAIRRLNAMVDPVDRESDAEICRLLNQIDNDATVERLEPDSE